jgi:hypothetical protein
MGRLRLLYPQQHGVADLPVELDAQLRVRPARRALASWNWTASTPMSSGTAKAFSALICAAPIKPEPSSDSTNGGVRGTGNLSGHAGTVAPKPVP